MKRIPQEGSEKTGAGGERLLKIGKWRVYTLRTHQRTFLEGDGTMQRKDLGGAGR